MDSKENKPLGLREKLVFALVVLLIKMLKPWQYDHQFENFWDELKNIINGGDFEIKKKP